MTILLLLEGNNIFPGKSHFIWSYIYTHVHTQNGNNKDTLMAIF